MNAGGRLALLALLVGCGVALIAILYSGQTRSPLSSTLTSSFQLLGTPMKFADRVASRLVPVDALDEKELGDVYRKRYDAQVKQDDPDQRYLDVLMRQIEPFAHKPFAYRAYVIDGYGRPNAMALPGGVILVTRSLLSTLRSEAELISVLAHEMGHIERGHCFDTVRFQLLSRKAGPEALGALADFATQILLRHSYSKTIEDEADEYAYTLMLNSLYDPMGVGMSFDSLLQYAKKRGETAPQHASPLRDYFMSHPPLEIRAAEFRARATTWWKRNPDMRRYTGRQNLAERLAFGTFDTPDEWSSRKAPR